MREFTKSVTSFSWSMSLFGLQQLTNLLTPQAANRPRHKATEAFDSVTRATEEQFGDILKETFKAGDKLQRGIVDMTLGIFLPRGLNPARMMGMASDTMQQATGCCGRGGPRDGSAAPPECGGWGPMPMGANDAD
jgi:hypothetical protein